MTLNSHQLPTVCPPLDCQLCTKSRREKRPGPHPGSTDNVSREVSAHQRRKKYQDCAYVFTVLYCAVQTEEKTVREQGRRKAYSFPQSLHPAQLSSQKRPRGFPGGAVAKSLPASVGGVGSIPGLGRFHMPWGI